MKKRMNQWLGVFLAAVLVALALTGCAAPPGPAAPAGAPQEGIKVHGHWTFEVTNPDGSLVERREFENALTWSGKYTLAMFLTRQYSVGQWFVRLETYPTAGGSMTSYFLCEPSSAKTGAYYFKNLTVTSPEDPDPNANKVVLQGSMTAQANLNIAAVQTFVYAPAPNLPPSFNSESGQDREFTWTVLPSNVAVSSGQQVAVTVVISFS